MSQLPGVYPIFNEIFKNYSTIWIGSDTHFDEIDLPNHPNGEELVKSINRQAGKKDLVILLGDVGDPSYLAKIKADKILLLGNHDKGVSNYERVIHTEYFEQQRYEALDEMKRLYPNCHYSIDEYATHWEVKADNKLADFVFEGPVMLGEKLILSHEPIPSFYWALNLHGHDHTGSKETNLYHYNVALPVNNYKLTNLNQLLKSGPTAYIQSLHRDTIDTATQKSKRRKKGE